MVSKSSLQIFALEARDSLQTSSGMVSIIKIFSALIILSAIIFLTSSILKKSLRRLMLYLLRSIKLGNCLLYSVFNFINRLFSLSIDRASLVRDRAMTSISENLG